jgi:hypothetical protein
VPDDRDARRRRAHDHGASVDGQAVPCPLGEGLWCWARASGSADVELADAPDGVRRLRRNCAGGNWNDYAGVDVQGQGRGDVHQRPGFHNGDESLFEAGA